MKTSQNTAIVKKIKVFVEIENEFIQILIKVHFVMCLALNKRPLMLRLHLNIQSADRRFVFLSTDKHQFFGRLKLFH